MKSLGSWRQPFFGVKVQSSRGPPAVQELSVEHWAAAVRQDTRSGPRHTRWWAWFVLFRPVLMHFRSRRVNHLMRKKKSVYCFVLWEWCFGVEGNRMASRDTGCASASRVCWSAEVQWNQCGKGVESEKKKYGRCDTASSAENSASAVRLGYCHYSAPLPLLPPPPLLRWPETPPGASGAPRSRPLPPSAQPRWTAGDLWAYSNGRSLMGRGISEEEKWNTGY